MSITTAPHDINNYLDITHFNYDDGLSDELSDDMKLNINLERDMTSVSVY